MNRKWVYCIHLGMRIGGWRQSPLPVLFGRSRKPKSKTQKAVEKEIANGFRGFKKFVKDVAEVGE